jgi:hypothetical protein
VTVPLNSGVTLAVKVTVFPTLDGFNDEAKVVVVVALLTTCFTAFDVLPPKFESPPYTAAEGGLEPSLQTGSEGPTLIS